MQHTGDWVAAEANCRRLIEMMPFAPWAYSNLGGALRGQGRWAEALAAYEQASRLQPDSPEIALNLASYLRELGALERAVECYRQALRLKPNCAHALTNLAATLIETGAIEEGITRFREALQLDPDQPIVYYFLSQLAAEGRCTLTPSEIARIKALASSVDRPALQRSQGCFALAGVYAKQGSYDEAFGWYRRANELRKCFQQEQKRDFDAQRHDALVDSIIATHDRKYFEKTKGWGLVSDLPVFIVGMPRSGSTLVEQILASHPQVFGAGEIGEVFRFITRNKAPKDNLPLSALLPNALAAQKVAAEYLDWMGKASRGAARATNKTLQNHLYLGLIATLFPRARIIHCRRNPFDVCLSCYFTCFKDTNFAWSLEDIGAYYRSYKKIMTHWSEVLPNQIFDVCYEGLVQNQRAVTQELLTFCGLSWNERCMSFHQTRRAVQTASTVQVRKPISTQAIGRWRHYSSHLSPLFKALDLPFTKSGEIASKIDFKESSKYLPRVSEDSGQRSQIDALCDAI
jgi:tetratricopeptide (TPR) repeat protein